tara:strand:+ start:11453 stop:11569 length:117 start_codon:yes stop_codon:yes gene_type:complete
VGVYVVLAPFQLELESGYEIRARMMVLLMGAMEREIRG